VVAVGWLVGEKPIWPWDLDTSDWRQTSAGDPEFARAFEEANRIESAARRTEDEKGYERAADRYRSSIGLARTDSESAAARLAWAQALKSANNVPDALAVFRGLLNFPLTTIDDYGYPFAWHAAKPLVDLGDTGKDVLKRVQQDLGSSAAFSTLQTLRLKSILEMLEKVDDPAIREGARSATVLLSVRVNEMGRAHDLLKDLPKLTGKLADWQPFDGKELLLVGRSPAGTAFHPLVIAVRAEAIRASVEANRLSRNVGPPFQIAIGEDSGSPLNDRIPGLQAIFTLPPVAETPIESNSQSSLWGLSFAVVIALTLFGGFLLWRDTRREAHLAELRTQFVSSVSHELKTPLTSIRMFAEILQMRGHRDPQLLEDYLETIVNESERLTRLLNNVLDFSRTERGNKMYRFEPAALTDVIHSAVRTIQYPMTEQGFVLDLKLAGSIPPVAVDRDALQQAILNLLTNAMKYSGEQREIELRLLAEGKTALIEVSDHGIGISEKEQSLIFEKYYRAPVPENREIAGAGLGLALVAHIVEAHGGSVRVQSKPGEGSTFSIRIPLNAGAAA
jgi:signal transduction histidine kinase